MPIITLHALSPKRQEAIRALHALCRQAEPLTLSCPEDADAYWLYTDRADELLSLLAAWQTEPGLWECCGFTRPDCRRQGYFYALLDAACGEGGILSQDDILFVADGRSADADRALGALKAQPAGREHLMECPLSPLPQEAAALLSMAEKQGLSLAFEENRVLLSGPGGRPLGSCRITSAGGQACLSSLMIEEARRGKGLGSCFLGLLLPALATRDFPASSSRCPDPISRLWPCTKKQGSASRKPCSITCTDACPEGAALSRVLAH